MGLAHSRKEARQLVRHAHFTINGKKVDVPSMLVNVGDLIEVKETSRSSAKFKDLVESSTRVSPKWLEVDLAAMKSRVVGTPDREDIDLEIKEHLIVELYSK